MDKERNTCKEIKRNDVRSGRGRKLLSTIVILFIVIVLSISCLRLREENIKQRETITEQREIIYEQQGTIAGHENGITIEENKEALIDVYTGGLLTSTVDMFFLMDYVSEEDFVYLNEFLHEFLRNPTVENINIYTEKVLEIIGEDKIEYF